MSYEPVGSDDRAEPIVNNPASSSAINWIGLGFLLIAVLLLYVLIASWPVLEAGSTGKHDSTVVRNFKSFVLFGYVSDWDADKRMLFTVVIAGAVGSLVHALTSFADFVGNRRFSANWIWWYGLRLPIGSALAIFFYFIIRGGLLVPTLQSAPGNESLQGATVALNPYGIAAFAALAGMFAKNASDKLSEVFDAVLTRKDPVKRGDTLRGGAGLKFEPVTLTVNKPEDLTITGHGFQKDTKLTVDGKDRTFQLLGETQIKFKIETADVSKPGDLKIAVRNPNGDVFEGKVAVVAVSAAKPVIAGTDPALTKGMSPAPQLTIKGSGFQAKCTATINGTPRVVPTIANTEIKIELTDADVKEAGQLKLVVINPSGASSDPHEIEVK